jgi:hypothetical protein
MYKFTKKKQGRCTKDTADHAAGGAAGDAGGAAGGEARSSEAPSHYEGLELSSLFDQIFQENFEFPWARLFQKRGSTRPPVTSHHQNPQLYIQRSSGFCSTPPAV